jgi:hypothetical protein
MTPELLRLYRRFRTDPPFMLYGSNAAQALSAAKTLLQFQELEEAGLVKIDYEPDQDPDASYIDDWPHLSERTRQRLKDEYYDTCVGVITYARTTEDDEWEDVDSIWGCAGYKDPTSPFENCYVIDLMDTAIKHATAPNYSI